MIHDRRKQILEDLGSPDSEKSVLMGTNGISLERGFTTPDIGEGEMKATAIVSVLRTWVLNYESKFDKIYASGNCDIGRRAIITNRLPDEKYREFTVEKETDSL